MRSSTMVLAVVCALARTGEAGPPQYFGFSWLHNPLAAAVPYSFTNIDVRPVYVSDPAAEAASDSRCLYDSYGVSSVLGFNDFLFGENNTTAVPRPDAIRLFDAWWDESVNRSTVRPPAVVAIWPADSALLRCGGSPDVAGCLRPYLDFVRHIRDTVAGTGVLLVDSFDSASVSGGVLSQQADALLDAGIRWFGYHQYGVLHPLTDPTYQANVTRVRQIVDRFGLLGYGTQFVLVGDAFGSPVHTKVVAGSVLPWDWDDYRTVAGEDFQIACRHDAIALILFNWPDYSWLEEQNTIGSVSFGDPAACWEACLGRFVKFGEAACTQCGGAPSPVGCRHPLRVRRRPARE